MATVINIMANGPICEDLSTYLNDHKLPEDAKRLILGFVRSGRTVREKRETAEE